MKKSTLNRALALFLVVSALFTLPAFAANNSYTTDDFTMSFDGSIVQPTPQPRYGKVAGDTVSGNQVPVYFSTNENNGKQLLITFTNAGKTNVNISLSVTGPSGDTTDPLTSSIGPGKSTEAKITANTGIGLSCDVTIILAADLGETMTCTYEAYQGNGIY